MSWGNFKNQSPKLAESGKRLLQGGGNISIAFISTCSHNTPHIAPVCPIFSGAEIYLCAAEHSPKTRDLRKSRNYSLHSFLGENDEEFQFSGSAVELTDEKERADVHSDIPFASFNKEDPIFRLTVDRVLSVYWERVGQPDTAAVRQTWSDT